MRRAPRVVIGCGNLATYPMGGGHWSWALQYLLGMRDVGADVTWLEVMPRMADSAKQVRWVRAFFDRMRQYGVEERCILVVDPGEDSPLDTGDVHGRTREEARRVVRHADVLLNLALSIRDPLLSEFRVRALLDGDPGHSQVSALALPAYREQIEVHDLLFTVGANINAPSCGVPTLGRTWIPTWPIVHLPSWPRQPAQGSQTIITSVTHWKWDTLAFEGRSLSASKRTAYLRYVGLPALTFGRFELAAAIDPDDGTGDSEVLANHGWRVVDPCDVCGDPAAYQAFIAGSSMELSCPKPVYRELRTGWFSDRSACYLASGRPVVMEDTAIGDHLPVGAGVVTFEGLQEAADAVSSVAHEFGRHSDAARALAERFFDAGVVLRALLAECGLAPV